MGSSFSHTITVTCDCGREMRVPRNLMGTSVSCPVCGASIDLPADPAAGIGPPCSHCGRPWPIDQMRCPSCMARSRSRRRREDDEGEGDGDSPHFSRKFAHIEPDPHAPGPEYEPPPTMDPATVRVKHWYEKPTNAGWKIATAVTALGALICLLLGLGSGGGACLGAGAALALCAVGLARGSGAARSLIVFGPVLIIAGGSIMAMWLAPDALSWPEVIILTLIVVALSVGLSVLTHSHGTVGVIAIGAVLAVVGLIATCIAVSMTDWRRTITGEVAHAVREGFAAAGDTLTATRPAPVADVDDDDDPEFIEPEPPAPPVVFVPVDPPEPVATQPASAPAPPRPPPTDWRAFMTDIGFEVTFANPRAVEATRGTVAVDSIGECDRTDLALLTAAMETRAVVYADVAAADEQAELIAVARHTAATVGGEISYQMWRNDRGPRVYYIRLDLSRDGRTWAGRVESCRVGDHVVALVGLHPKANRVAESRSWDYFKSFRRTGDAAKPERWPWR